MNADDFFAPTPAAVPRAKGYVLCEFDGLTVAIEQSDVLSIEHGSELRARLPGEPALGWFEGAQGPWPVYGLNANLELIQVAPHDRSFLAFLKTDDAPLGLLCESVRIVARRSDLNASALPTAMQGGLGPVRAVSRIDTHRLALITGERAIAQHIERLCDQASSGDWQ
jgi:hypothetical protein